MTSKSPLPLPLPLPTSLFTPHLSSLSEISSISLGSLVLSRSDDFFASADNLIKVEEPISLKGQFGVNGALYDGWESRRHNRREGGDWAIIRLPSPSLITGLNLDTTHFAGNEAPSGGVFGWCESEESRSKRGVEVWEGDDDPIGEEERRDIRKRREERRYPRWDSEEWQSILPPQPLAPSSPHLFLLTDPSSSSTDNIPTREELEKTPKLLEKFSAKEFGPFTHLKVHIYPDGGLARLRAYGRLIPSFPIPASPSSTSTSPSQSQPQPLHDLAHVLSGGLVVEISDQHYGKGGNLLNPGRGKDMGDGWETKRSRDWRITDGERERWKGIGKQGGGNGHRDWVVVKLGHPGYLQYAELDTKNFIGNFPEYTELEGTFCEEHIPPPLATWNSLLDRVKLGPHAIHAFQLEGRDQRISHVRMVIWPDGGVKRLRLYGFLHPPAPGFVPSLPSPSSAPSSTNPVTQNEANPPSTTVPLTIPSLHLSPSAFSPYGSVIQSYPNKNLSPPEVRNQVTMANAGTATRFNWLAEVGGKEVPSGEIVGKPNFCVFRCTPQIKTTGVGESEGNGEEKWKWEVKVLERHPYSTQTFVPMGSDNEKQGKKGRYLVLVALNGSDDKPDFSTLRAFVAASAQGISYNVGVWHHPLIAMDELMNFSCLVYETGKPEYDCEVLEWNTAQAEVLGIA